MKSFLALTVAILALAGCASGPDNSGARTDLYVAVALETGIGTLISLEQAGVLPPEGATMIESTLAYGGAACAILADDALDADGKRMALTTGLTEQRAEFDRAWMALAGSGLDREVLLVVTPALNGARAAVRVALTTEVDPAVWGKPCASVEALAASWAMQRPAA